MTATTFDVHWHIIIHMCESDESGNNFLIVSADPWTLKSQRGQPSFVRKI